MYVRCKGDHRFDDAASAFQRKLRLPQCRYSPEKEEEEEDGSVAEAEDGSVAEAEEEEGDGVVADDLQKMSSFLPPGYNHAYCRSSRPWDSLGAKRRALVHCCGTQTVVSKAAAVAVVVASTEGEAFEGKTSQTVDQRLTKNGQLVVFVAVAAAVVVFVFEAAFAVDCSLIVEVVVVVVVAAEVSLFVSDLE